MKVSLCICTTFLLLSACTVGSVKREKALKLKKVPSEVVAAFFKRHPDASSNFHKQEKGDEVSYEAHYMNGDKENSERFSKAGDLLETEDEIELDSISPTIKSKIEVYLGSADKNHKLMKTQKVHSKEFEGYELKVKTERSKTGLMEYFFNEDGSAHHHEELELKSIPTLY